MINALACTKAGSNQNQPRPKQHLRQKKEPAHAKSLPAARILHSSASLDLTKRHGKDTEPTRTWGALCRQGSNSTRMRAVHPMALIALAGCVRKHDH